MLSSDFVLDTVKNGYNITVISLPPRIDLSNNASDLVFVEITIPL